MSLRVADYDAWVEDGVIKVIDLNRGGLSVTNDAERVVEQVVKAHGDLPVLYRDTEGTWDWLVHDHGTFLTFASGSKPYPRTKS